MITVPTDSWYWAQRNHTGECFGPFNLKGEVAVSKIPSPEISIFGEAEGLMGQNFVSHEKTTLDFAIDGFSINGDERDIQHDPPSWRRKALHFPNEGKPWNAWSDGNPSGSGSRGGNSEFYDLQNDANGFTLYSYVYAVSGRNRFIFGTRTNVVVLSPLKVYNSTTALGNVHYSSTHGNGYQLKAHEIIHKPSDLRSFYDHSYIASVNTSKVTFFDAPFRRRSGLTIPDIPETLLREYLEAYSIKLRGLIPSGPPLRPYGILSQKAVDNLTIIDTNLLESLSEITSLKGLAKTMINIPKWVSSKKLAGDYLATKWGAIPFFDDLKLIYQSLSAIGPSVNNFGFVQCTGTDHIVSSHDLEGNEVSHTATRRSHIYLWPGGEITSLTRWLRNHGLFPTAANMWDIIPFSFAIDWFVNVGRYLESLDSNKEFSTLDIAFAVASEKHVLSTIVFVPDIGELEIIYSSYNRSPSREPIYPSYQFQSSDFSAHKRWLEAGALIMQRKK